MSKTELESKIKEAKEAENTGEYFSASFLYKNALELAKNLNDSQNITLCKNKIVEMNLKSDSAYKTFSTEQQIPTEEIDKVVNPILQGDLNSVLKKIGSSQALFPRINVVRDQASKSTPVSYQIASLSTISNDGHLVKGGSDGEIAWLSKMYSIHQGIISELYLNRIFSNLSETVFNTYSFSEYLKSTHIFSKENMNIIEIGIERYFANDYVSALHILIPQFENVFLDTSEKLGIDIISLNRGRDISTQLKTLSTEYLNSSDFQDKWGSDLCEQIKFILFDPLGYKLRHKVSHGVISKTECSVTNVNLILYLYLVLASRISVEIREKNE